jgi:hypothetical protein
VLGREPQPAEVTAGLEYLAAEPLRAYEERKAAEEAKKKEEAADPKKKSKPADAGAAGMPMDGMMAGVVPAPPGSEPPKKPLPVTPMGRYIKVLLSSSEFVFID